MILQLAILEYAELLAAKEAGQIGGIFQPSCALKHPLPLR